MLLCKRKLQGLNWIAPRWGFVPRCSSLRWNTCNSLKHLHNRRWNVKCPVGQWDDSALKTETTRKTGNRHRHIHHIRQNTIKTSLSWPFHWNWMHFSQPAAFTHHNRIIFSCPAEIPVVQSAQNLKTICPVSTGCYISFWGREKKSYLS